MSEGDDYLLRENENVYRVCLILVSVYGYVCILFVDNIDMFVDNGDVCYIWFFFMLIYNSVMEFWVMFFFVSVEDYRYKLVDLN